MFNTLFKMVIGVVGDRFSRGFSRISGSAAGFSREALRTAAILALVAAPLIAPQSAQAMNNWETAVVANYPGSSLSAMCASCHGDWGGRAVGNPLRVDYWIWGFGGGETPPAASPFYSNDHDMDGTTTGQEYTNSRTASPGPAVTLDWFPSFPDKDNDGYIQLYNRLGDTGMPNQALGVTADGWIGGGRGFIGYGPKGWDQDDNDPLKGNSTAWPTTSTPGTFVNPVATIDDGSPTTELPAAITNFRASGQIADAIPLVWTAVGDDGMLGDAHSYDLRYTQVSLANNALLCSTTGSSAVGTSSCKVRDKAHWTRMYDLIGWTADKGPCNVLSKTGLVTVCTGTTAALWNTGDTTSPLMRAFYEPVPTAPNSNQGCSTAPGQSATCTLTAAPAPSYVLKTQGIAGPKGAPVNVIANDQLYWLELGAVGTGS